MTWLTFKEWDTHLSWISEVHTLPTCGSLLLRQTTVFFVAMHNLWKSLRSQSHCVWHHHPIASRTEISLKFPYVGLDCDWHDAEVGLSLGLTWDRWWAQRQTYSLLQQEFAFSSSSCAKKKSGRLGGQAPLAHAPWCSYLLDRARLNSYSRRGKGEVVLVLVFFKGCSFQKWLSKFANDKFNCKSSLYAVFSNQTAQEFKVQEQTVN